MTRASQQAQREAEQRYPVRVRINAPESEPFRLSESAVVVIRGDEKAK